jgi:hypothetical protein
LFEKGNAFLRPLKNKGFKEEKVTTMRLDDLGQSTTLESDKSLKLLVANGARSSGLAKILWISRHTWMSAQDR